jgi:hypothetical protein
VCLVEVCEPQASNRGPSRATSKWSARTVTTSSLGVSRIMSTEREGRVDWRYHARLLGLAVLGAAALVVLTVLFVMLGLALDVWHIHDR